jgi:hypothetical protein
MTEEHVRLIGLQRELERQLHKKFVGLSLRDTIYAVHTGWRININRDIMLSFLYTFALYMYLID